MPFYNQLDPAFVPSVDTTSVGFGIGTLANLSTGIHNTGLGNNALNQVTTGNRNIAVGGLVGDSLTTGSDNTLLGHNAGTAVTTASNNTCVGSNAGAILSTGASNTIVGYNVASTTLATGSNNIIIGTSSAADAAAAGTSNSLWIGGGATAVLSATGINSTPAVTIPGTLTMTGAINKVTITPPATSATLTIADGKTLTANNNVTLAGGDGSTLAIAANKTLTVSNTMTLAGAGDAVNMTFPNSTDTVVTLAAVQTLTNKTLTDQIVTGTTRVTAQSDFASTTTLAALTGPSVALTASGSYAILGCFPVTNGSSGGVKMSLDTSNSLTLTSLNLTGKFFNSNSIAVANTTTFQGAVGATATVTLVELCGALVVNAAGTLIVKASQNASNATTTSILTNGFFQVTRIA